MDQLLGYIFVLNAVITWALASLVYKFGLGKTAVKASLLFRLTCVSSFTFLVSLIFGNYHFLFNGATDIVLPYFGMCFISGFSVTLGDILYFASLQKIDSSRAYPLTQLSLVFVYPFAFVFFGELISPSTLIGGVIILSSVVFLSSKDKPKKKLDNEDSINHDNANEKVESKEELLLGVLMAIGTAVLWAISIISFNQARILSNEVFSTNFIRIFIATIIIGIYGIVFDKQFLLGFKKESRVNLKYFAYIGIAGSLSLGLADSLFYKAAQLNGLVLTSTITANTPMAQQLLSVALLKEKFRPRFLVAVALIILGNYLILFL
ncbi:MAG: 4-amino-4-deoxy-L-arabinose-phosphoundecaprenol flippase subunit ArnF [Promethearchaeota archaeon]|nr:MAG: 4-amino-4-deoxy-L-arabinose-phosphoundecaprenol flippase subunit ArnF [Candidatus Lokiarchaeota archaeon]